MNLKIENINLDSIHKYLLEKVIFIGYPYKAFGKLTGIIYDQKSYILKGDKLVENTYFSYSTENIKSINSIYSNQGIYLNHPDLLCNVAKFKGYTNINGKMRRMYDEKASYVPFEITSLNSLSKDFDEFKLHFTYEYSIGDTKMVENVENEKKKLKFKHNTKNQNEEKEYEMNKIRIKPKVLVHQKFKKYPPGIRVENKKKMVIITQGPINMSEYRKNRIFQNENIEEHQIYYFRNPNNSNKLNNPNLIIK